MQDFLTYYRYTQKWVDLFHEEPLMIEIETAHYIKGMHNLLSAHFDLQNFEKFDATLEVFEKFEASEVVKKNANNDIRFSSICIPPKINRHFMYGTFKQGLELVLTLMRS